MTEPKATEDDMSDEGVIENPRTKERAMADKAKPKVVTHVPPPPEVTIELLEKVAEEARDWRASYSSQTAGMESVTPEDLRHLADELRELLSAFIDSGLDGHEITKEQWERACLLCGRCCAPYVHATTRRPEPKEEP